MLPVSAPRRDMIQAELQQTSADLVVLTEAYDALVLDGYPYHHSSAPGRDGGHPAEHHWVTIWSRAPVDTLEVSDVQRTAAVRVVADGMRPYVVFGTVLPWIGSPWREMPAGGGVAFRASLQLQLQDWTRLRAMFPEDEFFVLGDFNQDLVAPRYYGSRVNRAALKAALAAVGLAALTAGSADPIRLACAPYACIDHVCGLRTSAWRVAETFRWPETAAPVRRVSDHFGVGVRLVAHAPAPGA